MKSAGKIATLQTTGRILSVTLMLFLLSFLTVGNWFVYGDADIVTTAVTNSNDGTNDDTNKIPISSEEEKPSSSKNVSSSLTEEYLHDHDPFLHLYTPLLNAHSDHIHTDGWGDDYSRLHCPPPDDILS